MRFSLLLFLVLHFFSSADVWGSALALMSSLKAEQAEVARLRSLLAARDEECILLTTARAQRELMVEELEIIKTRERALIVENEAVKAMLSHSISAGTGILEADLRMLIRERDITKVEHASMEIRLREMTDKLSEITGIAGARERERLEAVASLTSMQEVLQRTQAAERSAEEACGRVQAEKEVIQRQLDVLNSRVLTAESEVAALHVDLAAKADALAVAGTNVAALTAVAETRERERVAAVASLTSIRETLESTQDAAGKAEEARSRAQAEKEALQKQLDALNSRVLAAESGVAAARAAKSEALAAAEADMAGLRTSVASDLRDAAEQRARLEAECQRLRKEIVDSPAVSADIAALAREARITLTGKLSEDLRSVFVKLAETREQVRSLEAGTSAASMVAFFVGGGVGALGALLLKKGNFPLR